MEPFIQIRSKEDICTEKEFQDYIPLIGLDWEKNPVKKESLLFVFPFPKTKIKRKG